MISYSGEIVKVPMTEESLENAKEMLKTDRHYTKKALGCISAKIYIIYCGQEDLFRNIWVIRQVKVRKVLGDMVVYLCQLKEKFY